MGQRIEQARKLEVAAREARTLAEAQALHAQADRLRLGRRSRSWSTPLFWN
jgi:hypothetical protein